MAKFATGQQGKEWEYIAQVQRSGDESAAVLDYDIQNERVTLTAEQPCRSFSSLTVSSAVCPLRDVMQGYYMSILRPSTFRL